MPGYPQIVQGGHLLLCQLVEKDALIKTSAEILSKPYRKRTSENALFIFYWRLRFAHTKGTDINGAALLQETTRQRPEVIDLTGAELTRADIPYMDLRNARLDGASLPAAVLSGCILRGATLNGANLSRADMDHADLSGRAL